MKTTVVAVMTALLLGTLGMTSAPTQAAPAQGTVTGVVVDEAGKPIKGVRVFASYPGRLDYDGDTITGADGRFSLKAQAGTATLGFGDLYPRTYAVATRSGVVVPAGGTTNVRQTMTVGAVLTGTLARADGSKPLTESEVEAFPLDQSDLERRTDAAHLVYTAKNGSWRITGLKPGRYRLQMNDGFNEYLRQCVGAGPVTDVAGQSCEDGGTAFTVTGPTTNAGTLTMTYRHPRVVGTIRGVGNKPLPGSYVSEVYPSDPDSTYSWGGFADGTYTAFTTGCPKICFAFAADGTKRYARAQVTLPTVGINQTGRADVRLRSITALTTKTRVGRKKATVVTTVAPKVSGAARTGTVTIRYKKTNGKAGTRTAKVPRSGKVSIHLPRAKSGKRTLTIVYGGNADTTPRTVRTTARVR